jgi:hypothetical protein
MRTFEKPGLCESAVQIDNLLSNFASITALWRKVGFQQTLRGLCAYVFAHVAYVSVARTTQFQSIKPGCWLPAFCKAEDEVLNCPAVALRNGDPAILRGTCGTY